MNGAVSRTPLPGSLSLAFRFALREMRGGLSGFLVFLACISLGVAAIAGVNSVARSIMDGVAGQANILGGDIRFLLNQRRRIPPSAPSSSGLGTVSESSLMRSMARWDGSTRRWSRLRRWTSPYHSLARWKTEPALPRADLFAKRRVTYGAAGRAVLCSSG